MKGRVREGEREEKGWTRDIEREQERERDV